MRRWLGMVAVLSLAHLPAWAHSWYEPACCSGQDCRQVPARDVRENADGSWTYLPEGLLFSADRVRESQDEAVHVCISEHPEGEAGGKRRVPRCLYLPRPRGF